MPIGLRLTACPLGVLRAHLLVKLNSKALKYVSIVSAAASVGASAAQRSPLETQCQQLKELCMKNPSDGCAASSPFRGASQLLIKQKPLLKGCGLPVADVAVRQQHRPRRQPRRWHAVGVTEGVIYKVANTIYFVLFLKLLTLTGDPHPAAFSSNLPQNLTAKYGHSI